MILRVKRYLMIPYEPDRLARMLSSWIVFQELKIHHLPQRLVGQAKCMVPFVPPGLLLEIYNNIRWQK